MSLGSLPPLLAGDPAVTRLAGSSTAVLAVPDSARAFVIAGLVRLSARRPFLVVVPTTGDAERLAADLTTMLSTSADEGSDGANSRDGTDTTDAMGRPCVEIFPAWETLPFERVSPNVETMGRRLRVLWRLSNPDLHPDRLPDVVVAPVRALIQRLAPAAQATVEPISVRPGDQVDPEELVARLVAAGYRREYQVEHRGEIAVRGSIVDVFPSTADAPVRIDLWGDEVDRLTAFAVADQRSAGDLDEVEIFGCREVLATDDIKARAQTLVADEPWGREQWERLAEGQVFEGMESWLPWLEDADSEVLPDRLGGGAQIVLVEPRRMRDRAGELLDEEVALADTLAQTWSATGHDGTTFPRLHIGFERLLATTPAPAWHLTAVPEGPETTVVQAQAWDPVVGGGEHLVKQVGDFVREGYRVVVCAEGRGTADRMLRSFAEAGLTVADAAGDSAQLARPGVRMTIAPLERGFILPGIKLAVLAEADVTGRRRAHRRAKPRKRATAGFFDDLKPGDYVVHHQHGVGRYAGMVTRAIGGAERDYLLIEYRGGDKLYVPSDQVDAVRPYSGGESPSLHRLGGSDWEKTKSRVRKVAKEIAQELVVLYRRRITAPGHQFPADSPWQRELEESFPYEETPDQLKAIAEVKEDMESEHPMDRLVCGDVGFGKTEVALRGVFKCVQDGKQAAVLVPTTLLAQQHFQTFTERFSGYPVRVEVLSRFLTPGQARTVLAGLADGSVDVVIGTHKLLSSGVKFKDLGLLVVDEEQRFGVTHKESIKQLRANVDVLTLTATPIPRTLEMSLTGIRDLTLLNTPPADRQPILTYVGEYDERAVAEAIRRELLREGQVFFVHNRVQDIEDTSRRIRELVPEARVATAHGQMDEGTLEKVVLDFWEGEFDVLVCTTIIESGIDMPTVNTLVVDRAERLGLGQLHQLRGRVGRAGQRAYAYLFFPPNRELSEEAYERLKTIGEHTELGSGFKIAMRDLEIRGAGNLLGGDQSGHIAAVGYDLYVQMVSEAVSELKGEEVREPAEIKLELPLDAYLPSDYVSREDLRIEAYRRLAVVTTQAEVDDIAAEWADRFGAAPAPAEALLRVARLRAECVRIGIRELTVAKDIARISPLDLKMSQRVRLERRFPKAVYKEDLRQLVLPMTVSGVRAGRADPADFLIAVLGELVPGELTRAAS
ncbi:MAG: transcription-repair coupling factor [Acidimicrobiales bacterium]